MSAGHTLSVDLAPSRGFAVAVIATHAAAGICVAATVPGLAGVAIAILLLALGIASAWDRALLRHRSSITRLVIQGPHSVRLRTGDGAEVDVRVSGRKYVSRLAVIFTAHGSMRRTILVARDMLDAESFRKLRLWALWGGLSGVAPEQLAA